MSYQTRRFDVVPFHRGRHLCFRANGWEFYPMQVGDDELNLTSGRFQRFDRFQHPYTVDAPYRRTGAGSFADMVEWIAEEQSRWSFAINRLSVTEVSVRFAFSDPITAVGFALIYSG